MNVPIKEDILCPKFGGVRNKKVPTAVLAAHATHGAKPITPTMKSYAAWLTAQTGHTVDPLSVQLGSTLRATGQGEQRHGEAASD